ncbi:MAG: hypothetical protein ACK5JF_02720 [Oscillospiraceae bacterium]
MKPMLFNTAMVRAIQAGQKTVTRRVVKGSALQFLNNGFSPEFVAHPENGFSPFGFAGDALYVRETWTCIRDIETGHRDYFYAANQKDYDTVSSTYLCDDDGFDTGKPFPWKPSIHMPKAIARLFLRVTDVRVERLQDITEEQAKKEGCCTFSDKIGDGKFRDVLNFDLTAKDAFAELWNSTLPKNPNKFKCPENSWKTTLGYGQLNL